MLLFLHGFLGKKEDWDPLLSHLPSNLSPLAIDLPGHGGPSIEEDIALTIKREVGGAHAVVGYSAGGRIALELRSRFPKDFQQAICLSAHPGLQCQKDREARISIEKRWIELLQTHPLEEFLEMWYRQPLFSPFQNHPSFPLIFQRRKRHDPVQLAQFLHFYSLGKKLPRQIFPKTVWVHGREDLKYANLYRTLQLDFVFEVERSGHCVHLENPKGCAKAILRGIDVSN